MPHLPRYRSGWACGRQTANVATAGCQRPCSGRMSEHKRDGSMSPYLFPGCPSPPPILPILRSPGTAHHPASILAVSCRHIGFLPPVCRYLPFVGSSTIVENAKDLVEVGWGAIADHKQVKSQHSKVKKVGWMRNAGISGKGKTQNWKSKKPENDWPRLHSAVCIEE